MTEWLIRGIWTEQNEADLGLIKGQRKKKRGE